MKKIFITGGAGFIGSHISEKIYKSFPFAQITILDKLTYAGNTKFLSAIIKSKRVKFIKGDILDTSKYKNLLFKCDLALNIAAESHVDNSFRSPLKFSTTNALGAHAFLLACIEKKVKKILHISSDEVYGEIKKGTFTEKNLVNPTNPYSASKAAAEILINSYKYTYKREIIIVRPNNIYGIRQYPEKLISTCICNLLENKKIPIHGDGQNIRYYLSALDFAEAIIILIKKRDRGIYNIGSDFFLKNINLVKIICKFMKKNPNKYIKFVDDRAYNDKRYSVSSKKIKKIGWKAKRNLIDDLPDIIKWYRANYKIFKKNEKKIYS